MTVKMSVAKITISMEQDVLEKIDRLVHSKVYPNRSKAVQEAVNDKILRLDKHRLKTECAKLDREAEQALADEGLGTEVSHWPEY